MHTLNPGVSVPATPPPRAAALLPPHLPVQSHCPPHKTPHSQPQQRHKNYKPRTAEGGHTCLPADRPLGCLSCAACGARCRSIPPPPHQPKGASSCKKPGLPAGLCRRSTCSHTHTGTHSMQDCAARPPGQPAQVGSAHRWPGGWVRSRSTVCARSFASARLDRWRQVQHRY